MSFFDNDQDEYYDDRRRGPGIGSQIGFWLIKALSFIFGLPAIAIGAAHFYLLFVKGRLRYHIISIITFIELAITIPIFKAMNPFKNMFSAMSFTQGFDWGAIFVNYFMICWIIGIIGSYFMIGIKVYQFERNPSLLFMDGWTYKFSYRTTPWEIIKKNVLIKKLIDGEFYGPKAAPLGVLVEPVSLQVPEIDVSKKSLESVDTQVVSRDYREAMKHTLITGGTGAGKTVSMLTMMYNDIQSGYPVFVVDFKKSPDVLYFLSKWAKDFDRPFYYFSNGDEDDKNNPVYDGKSTYDPFSSGDQNARADNIVSLREWDTASAVYKDRSQALVTALSYALLNVDHADVPGIPWDKGGLHQMIAALDLVNMIDLITALNKKNKRKEGLSPTDVSRLKTLTEIYQTITSKKKEGNALREQLEGIKLMCNKLIMSSYGNWLAKDEGSTHIDLLKLMIDERGPIVLFGFSENEEQEFATAIGTIVIKDIQRAADIKNKMDNDMPCGIYFDEFQTLNPDDITGLLEKVRSARLFCTLSTQSLEKIAVESDKDGEATLKSVLDTCSNYLFHAGAKQDSAERMSKILGETNHISRGVMGDLNSSVFNFNIFNVRQARSQKQTSTDWIVPPSKFQNLSIPTSSNKYKSEAYFISSVKFNEGTKKETSYFGAQRIQVVAQKEITDGIPADIREYLTNLAKKQYNKQVGHAEDISGIAIPTEILNNNEVNDIIEENDWEIEEVDGNSAVSEGFTSITTPSPTAPRPQNTEAKGITSKPKEVETVSKPKGLPKLPAGGFKMPALEPMNTSKQEEKKEEKAPPIKTPPTPSKPKKGPRIIDPKDVKGAPLSRD